MDLARRALLMGLVAMPVMPVMPASSIKQTQRPRAVFTTGISTRVLNSDDDKDNSPDGKDIGIHGTHFGDPKFIGPYLSENQTKAVFKARTPSRTCLVRNGISLNDVHQGLVGDCWFLSALDFSIAHPKYKARIENGLFEDVNGLCRVSLFDISTSQWQTTSVGPHLLLDGMRFPATVSAMSSDPDEMWLAMVEKGLAKMCTRSSNNTRGYNAIGGGWMSEAMCYLHGPGKCYFIPRVEILPLVDATQFIITMDKLLNDGCGVFVVWSKEVFNQFSQGLIYNHGYSVLSVDIKAGSVTIKNPWGRGLWTNNESNDSCKGVFTMNIVDLLVRCNGLDKGMLIVKSKLICDAIIGVTNFSL